MSVQTNPQLEKYRAYRNPSEEEGELDELYYFYDDENNFEKLRFQDMPGAYHDLLITYLKEVLVWFYRLEQCAVYRELNFYETDRVKESPLYPDLAILKGQQWQGLTSYRLGVTGPAPDVVIEIISAKTRYKDLYYKPERYARWGTAEYFAYDNRPNRQRRASPRLSGWRLNQAGVYEPLLPAANDRIWSEQLNSWLLPDEAYLRLYTPNGEQRLTEAQAKDALLRQMGIDTAKL